MRLLLDLQACQSAQSKDRGIGRYSLSLAKALVQQAKNHEILIGLSAHFPDTIEPLKAVFASQIPPKQFVLWQSVQPTAACNVNNQWRALTGECFKETLIRAHTPDIIHTSSLFEGFDDAALTSTGSYTDERNLNSVTLYDLIPYLYPQAYLTDPTYKKWYLQKIGQLKRADICLAISTNSRQEAITHLGLAPEQVVNIAAGVDPRFKPLALTPSNIKALLQRYGLDPSFVLYTGGINPRKNVEGLIQAYALLPEALRSRHQLVIVCSISPEDLQRLTALAQQQGLSNRQVVFTGYVADQDLPALLSLCELFVFPSWHEGFGLPVLEAMACGAAVIGSDRSSIPEILEWPEALFNPHEPEAIKQKIQQALMQPDFLSALKKNSVRQTPRFSWDNTGKLAWAAFEAAHDQRNHKKNYLIKPLQRRPRLAFISPLPPARSGIADYSARLLRDLMRYYDIELIVNNIELEDEFLTANFSMSLWQDFDQRAHRFERVLYHFGNSPFHSHMFGMLERHPGTVVLHDFYLSAVLEYDESTMASPYAWSQALFRSHGYTALYERFQIRTSEHLETLLLKYPCNAKVLNNANGVIVHSAESVKLARHWYGNDADRDWAVLPLLRELPLIEQRSASRKLFALTDNELLVCSFGMLGRTKCNDRLLAVWQQLPPALRAQARLVFVGSNDTSRSYGLNLAKQLNRLADDSVSITGFVEAENYAAYLHAADVAVQLRSHSRGETSAAVLDCLAHGIATIINQNGAMAELPEQAVVALPDIFSDEALKDALQKMLLDAKARRQQGQAGREYISMRHSPAVVAENYWQAIEQFALYGPASRTNQLIDDLVRIEALSVAPPNTADWTALSHVLSAYDASGLPHQPQLLVDVTEMARHDAKTGIQRVVRSVLYELLRSPPPGLRVEPIYRQANGNYCYARKLAFQLLGLPTGCGLLDERVETGVGDIFLGLDLVACALANPVQLKAWRDQGMRMYYVIYDLLPVLHPEWFPPGVETWFAEWLNNKRDVADGVVCISKAVADEWKQWIARHPSYPERPTKVGFFHLGADIEASHPTTGCTPGFNELIAKLVLTKNRNVLMVGTLEPRKGYAQALQAFEALWAQGAEINWIVVGKPGWAVNSLLTRLRDHSLAGHRLFWFDDASDEMLSKLYSVSAGVLMASEGEGFGLPLIEAAQHNCPILARDLPVFKEIAGHHATYFSGMDPLDLAESIRQWLLALDCNRAALPQAMPWLSWRQSTAQLLKVILHNEWYLESSSMSEHKILVDQKFNPIMS